ncbi:hypothetical protein PAPHI01_1212 [Pancytospora philotis]|nr:hypothetical protein PAPHI01_1212 [Pancytospora philotis]
MSIAELTKTYEGAQETAKGYRGLSAAEAAAGSRRNASAYSWQVRAHIAEQLREIVLEPINVLMFTVCGVLVMIYIISPEEKEHLAACIFTVVIMVLNIIHEVYNQQKLRRIVRSNKSQRTERVYRDGARQMLGREEVVPGDVIAFKRGDVVHADCRLIHAEELEVDASVLSGSPDPLRKNTAPFHGAHCDSPNMLFESNVVLRGGGVAVVLRVGGDTVLARLSSQASARKTAFSTDIDTFFSTSFILATLITVLLVVYCIFFGYTFIQLASIAVSVYISVLPEGIPSLMKLLLYCGALKLRGRDILVCDINAIQRCSEISVLCIDKAALVVPDELICEIVYDGNRMIGVESAFQDGGAEELAYLRVVGEVCYLVGRTALAEHSRAALDDAAHKADPHYDLGVICEALLAHGKASRAQFETTDSSETTHSQLTDDGVLFTVVDKQRYKVLYAVANPEQLVAKCRSRIKRGSVQRLNSFRRRSMVDVFKKFSKHGYRLVGLACASLSASATDYDRKKLTFVAYMCLKERTKDDAALVLDLAQASGIKVCIVHRGAREGLQGMGDDLLDSLDTCAHIEERGEGEGSGSFATNSPRYTRSGKMPARQPGSFSNIKGFIDTSLSRLAIYEASCGALSEAIQNAQLGSALLVCRAGREQKGDLVEQFQAAGHVVAYCGNGEDDLAALGNADVAFTCEGAAPICKERASIVLREKEMSGLIYSLEEGRLYFVNLQKAIRYIMMHITPQMVALSFFVFLEVPLPISPILLIFLDYLIEVLPAIYFAYEDPEYNLITAGPKSFCSSQKDFVVNMGARGGSRMAAMRSYLSRLANTINNESLYSRPLLRSSVFETGLITSFSCLVSFSLALYLCGVPLSHQFFVSGEHFRYHAHDLDLGAGVVINSEQQLYILYRAQSTFFLSLVICQIANLIICRRSVKLVSSNFFENPRPLILSLAGAAVSCLLIYMPWFEDFLLIRKPVLLALTVPLCAAVLLIAIDYLKKLRLK